MNADFTQLIFTRCGVKKKETMGCELYSSKKSGESWSEPELIPFFQKAEGMTVHRLPLDIRPFLQMEKHWYLPLMRLEERVFATFGCQNTMRRRRDGEHLSIWPRLTAWR